LKKLALSTSFPILKGSGIPIISKLFILHAFPLFFTSFFNKKSSSYSNYGVRAASFFVISEGYAKILI
jgi:hypothetical protein